MNRLTIISILVLSTIITIEAIIIYRGIVGALQ
jgi:hypothetical protein